MRAQRPPNPWIKPALIALVLIAAYVAAAQRGLIPGNALAFPGFVWAWIERGRFEADSAIRQGMGQKQERGANRVEQRTHMPSAGR